MSGTELFRLTQTSNSNFAAGWNAAGTVIPADGTYNLVPAASNQTDRSVETELFVDRLTGFDLPDLPGDPTFWRSAATNFAFPYGVRAHVCPLHAEGPMIGRPPIDLMSVVDLHAAGLADGEIADRLGVCLATAASCRRRLGLPSNQRRGRPARVLPSSILAMLGVVRDVEVAGAAGVTRERVRQWRVARGIPRAPHSSRD